MNVKRKVTWKDIFNNFKSVYPRLSKEAQDYRPYNYMSIIVYLADGTKVVYDDMVKRAKMLACLGPRIWLQNPAFHFVCFMLYYKSHTI